MSSRSSASTFAAMLRTMLTLTSLTASLGTQPQKTKSSLLRGRSARAWRSDTEYDPEIVLKGCGAICDDAAGSAVDGRTFKQVTKDVDCMGLYSNSASDAPADSWPPLRINQLPDGLKDDFLMHGKVKMADWYIEERQADRSGNEVPTWTSEQIDKLIGQASGGNPESSYGPGAAQELVGALKKQAGEVKGKHFFVLGSQLPWVEALLLAAGAGHVTTIEYGKIESKDPRVSTMTPADVRRKFVETGGREPRFDGGVTFSSIEHSGLGRYGDRLNPWGDYQAMAKAWCITRPHGLLFAGMPTGGDYLVYNAHRIYGPKRLAQLFANWQQIDAPLGVIDENRGENVIHQPVLTFARSEAMTSASIASQLETEKMRLRGQTSL